MTDWSHAFNTDFARGNLRALEDSRLRFVFAYAANRQPATLNEIRRVKRESIDPNPLAHLQIAVHPTTANYENTLAAQRLAEELGVVLDVHLHESPADPATGQLDTLRRAGALRPGLLTNHVVQMTDAELDELATHGVRVAHNPLSNMRLASGIARVPDMRARGIKIGLGLDGGTNDSSDMFADMKAAVDFAPELDWISQLVFNAQPAHVEWVFVAGRALKREGRVVGDQSRVIADAQAASDRIQRLLGRNAHPGGR